MHRWLKHCLVDHLTVTASLGTWNFEFHKQSESVAWSCMGCVDVPIWPSRLVASYLLARAGVVLARRAQVSAPMIPLAFILEGVQASKAFCCLRVILPEWDPFR